MTSSGKIRIYELSRDLNLDNKDVLDAAHKLSISAKSHSSSISEEEANAIKKHLKKQTGKSEKTSPKTSSSKEILSVKKAHTPEKAVAHPNKKQVITSKSDLPDKKSILKKPVDKTNLNTSISKTKKEGPKKSVPSKEEIQSKDKDKQYQNLKKDNPSQLQKPLAPKPRELKTPIKTIPPVKKPDLNNKIEKASQNKKPQIISSPKAPAKSSEVNKSFPSSVSPNQQKSKQELINRPQPPVVVPPSRPVVNQRNQNKNLPSKNQASKNKKTNIPNKQPGAGSPLQKPNKSNPVELFGAPIRRDRQETNKPNPNSRNSNNRQVAPPRPGAPLRQGPARQGPARQGPPRQGPPSRQGAPVPSKQGAGIPRQGPPSRQSAPRRAGIPSGMRKPVAPGELMQLQKPSGRPGVPPPRRTNSPQNISRKENSDGSTSTSNRPTASSPKRPPQRQTPTRPGAARTGAPNRPGAARPGAPNRPGAPRPGAPGRPGAPRKNRPDWDDSAKLDALRNKPGQKQRQKVHIIGENDDALTTETSGFAGEQQATLLSASLARPAKPKATQKATGKSITAIRKRKKETTRQRQRRRAMELRAAREAKQVRPEMIVVPEGNLTVQELADLLSLESSEIIKSLFFKGITATVTQSLDLATIETVADEFGVPVLQDDVEEAAKKTVEMIEETDLNHLIRRPPVVTVMGHVDHGKTSLLDAIRKARVAAGEAGGITQHIGAYQVDMKHDGVSRKLTFLDTPGHEAFTAMRARGTKVTDVAVLVVAADDGVRPQTLEAISHARAAEVPIVVAINKIDKEGASADRVKQELSEQELLAEEWGGDVVMTPVSAIKGENIDKLLEMILLVTEVEDLQANPERLAKGTVIEAHLDKAKGPVATLLVQNGTLKSGDVIAAGAVLGKVRAMVDEHGSRLKEAGPSCPVEALGFSEVPTAGDEFEVYPDEKSARSVVGDRATDARATKLAQQMATRRVSLSGMSGQASEGDLKELNIILKADVQGSIEAILGSLEQLPKDEVQVRVLLSAPGEITETDVDLAAASGAVIVGFNTSMASGAKRAADASGVDVRDYEVIYKLLEDIQLAMEGLLEPEMVEESLGEAEVRAIFSIGKNAVAGCYITNGKLQRNCKLRVKRGSQIVFEGDLDSLRRNKDDVKEVATGFECGVGSDRFSSWQEKDIIQAFKLVTQKRKLST